MNIHEHMRVLDDVELLEKKINDAEKWLCEQEQTSPIFEKGFARFRVLINERAALFLEEIKPVEMKLM